LVVVVVDLISVVSKVVVRLEVSGRPVVVVIVVFGLLGGRGNVLVDPRFSEVSIIL
jgi:hypothetical protein